MTKQRLTALLLAVVIIALAFMRTATANHQTSHKAFSGGSGFRGLVVKTDSERTDVLPETPTWQTVDSRGFEIPAGERQLIVVDFVAELNCRGIAGDGFCTARVVVGRTLSGAQELEPAVGASFVLSEAEAPTSTESMRRSLCIRNATASPLNVSVWVQAARVDDVASFVLDDWSFSIARNAPCSPSVDI